VHPLCSSNTSISLGQNAEAEMLMRSLCLFQDALFILPWRENKPTDPPEITRDGPEEKVGNSSLYNVPACKQCWTRLVSRDTSNKAGGVLLNCLIVHKKHISNNNNKIRGLSPRANYTDQGTSIGPNSDILFSVIFLKYF
jgi:hypothetical protein